MAGKVTIAEVEHLYDAGELDPDKVHLPGIYVQRILPISREQVREKRIERRTVRPKVAAAGAGSEDLENMDGDN